MSGPVVLKSSYLRERERERSVARRLASATRERDAHAEQQQRERSALAQEQERARERAASADRAVAALAELATRTHSTHAQAVAVAAADTVTAAAALAGWFLHGGDCDPVDPAGAQVLTARLQAALESLLPAPETVVLLAPQDLDTVGALLEQRAGMPLRVRADTSLLPGEARITGGDGSADLTIGGALRRATEALLGAEPQAAGDEEPR